MTKKINISRKPLTQKSADDWVSSRQSTIQDEPLQMKRLTIDLTAELHAKIKVQCAKDRAKMVDVIRDMLQDRFGGAV